MQANSELTSTASLGSEICEDFSWKMKLDASDFDQTEKSPPSDEEIEDDDDDDDDEEFSFACIGADESPISADDAFHNGQIKPIFPLFDQSLLYAVDASDLPRQPPVKKVFVEAEDSAPPSTAEEGEEEAAGPYCAWSRKAVEASPETCKKSNSTGFSKIWRFRELSNRSNSDGRDAFVFLNNGPTATNSTRDKKVEEREISSEKKPAAAGEGKANNSGPASLGNGKVLKKGTKKKGETASLSAHEMHYVRNRALREGDRRRSYLPYRPELVGFFTNVNGGLSRNVHHPY